MIHRRADGTLFETNEHGEYVDEVCPSCGKYETDGHAVDCDEGWED